MIDINTGKVIDSWKKKKKPTTANIYDYEVQAEHWWDTSTDKNLKDFFRAYSYSTYEKYRMMVYDMLPLSMQRRWIRYCLKKGYINEKDSSLGYTSR